MTRHHALLLVSPDGSPRAVLTVDGPFGPSAGTSKSVGDLAAVRTRVTVHQTDGRPPVVDEHLRVAADAPHPWPSLADVLLERSGARARTTPDELARTHPGALVVAVPTGSRCRVRLGAFGRGSTHVVVTRRPGTDGAHASWGIVASLLHAWLVAGLPATAWEEAVVIPLVGGWAGAGASPGERGVAASG